MPHNAQHHFTPGIIYGIYLAISSCMKYTYQEMIATELTLIMSIFFERFVYECCVVNIKRFMFLTAPPVNCSEIREWQCNFCDCSRFQIIMCFTKCRSNVMFSQSHNDRFQYRVIIKSWCNLQIIPVYPNNLKTIIPPCWGCTVCILMS